MQHLEVSGAVRPLELSLGVKRLIIHENSPPLVKSFHNTERTLAKNAIKPNPFEIILLQTTRKEKNWKTEET